MRSSQSRALFSFTFVSAGPGDAVSFNVPVYASASAVVQEKRLTLDGSSGVSVWAAPVAVTAIARTVSGQLVAVEATVDRPTVAEVPSGGGGSGLPVPGSGDAGKVVTVTGGEDGFELDAPAGGASGLFVRSLHVVHTNPDLLTGIEWWTPAAGEVFPIVYYYSSFEKVTVVWDGSTPTWNLGWLDGGGTFTPFANYHWSAGNSTSDDLGAGFRHAAEGMSVDMLVAPGGVAVGVLLDDGAGGDPGVTTGDSILYIATSTPIAT